jgi:hypothetical protein
MGSPHAVGPQHPTFAGAEAALTAAAIAPYFSLTACSTSDMVNSTYICEREY